MNPQLFAFLLGVFITMFLGGLIGLALRKLYRSPLEKRLDKVDIELTRLDVRTQCTCTNINGLLNDAIADRKKSNNTDSGLQSLYEVVRGIDKDVKRLKKKAKGKAVTIDAKDIVPGEIIKESGTIGGVPFMNCSHGLYSEIPDKNGYIRVNDPEYYYYHGNTMEKPGSTYKQIEFDSSTDMLTIVLNDGRKIASDITYIRDLLLKEAKKLQ